MRFGLGFVIYIVVGVLVAAGIIGNEDNYFSGLSNIEEIIEMLLAVFLWPLVLLDVSMNIGGESGGSGGGDAGGGGGGGNAEAGGGGDKK